MTMVLSWTELLKYRVFVTSQNCIYFRRNLRKNIQFFDVTKSLYLINADKDSSTAWEVAVVCIKIRGCENSFVSSLLPTDEENTLHQKGAFTFLVLPDSKKIYSICNF